MQPNDHTMLKRIVVIVVILILVAGGLYLFFFKTSAPVSTLDQYGNPVEAQVVGQDLIDLLNELQSVTLDNSIFRKQAFINLTDFKTNLPDEPLGRANPFSPIGR